MIAVLLLLLLVVWAAVLIPPWLRGRAQHSPQSSIAGFNRRLTVLASRSGGDRPLPGFAAPIPAVPQPDSNGLVPLGGLRQTESQRRRTMILEALLVAGGCSLVLGLFPPLSFFLWLFVLDLVALGGYILLLLQWKRNTVERIQKVTPLATRVSSVPAFAVERRGFAVRRQAR